MKLLLKLLGLLTILSSSSNLYALDKISDKCQGALTVLVMGPEEAKRSEFLCRTGKEFWRQCSLEIVASANDLELGEIADSNVFSLIEKLGNEKMKFFAMFAYAGEEVEKEISDGRCAEGKPLQNGD